VDKPKPDEPKSGKSHTPDKPRKDAAKHDARASDADHHEESRQPATVDKPRRTAKTGHRLRKGRRAR
jgi:hypothetical protein